MKTKKYKKRGGQKYKTYKKYKKYKKYKTYKKKLGGDVCNYDNKDPDWNENKVWPINFGCDTDSNEIEIILPKDKILDRIGWVKGYFLGEPGYSYDSRSLRILKKNKACKKEFDRRFNKGSFPDLIEYHQYTVLKPFRVMSCYAKPFFGHNGGSIQYRLFENSLEDGDISSITEKNDITDAYGIIKPSTKVPNIKELLVFGYIKESEITNPPDFM